MRGTLAPLLTYRVSRLILYGIQRVLVVSQFTKVARGRLRVPASPAPLNSTDNFAALKQWMARRRTTGEDGAQEQTASSSSRGAFCQVIVDGLVRRRKREAEEARVIEGDFRLEIADLKVLCLDCHP